ncbi:hypothetical protein [Nocardiopsis valliformis]|uniref:hypothetical protein n=1 Tax=Nocardiopsis valliformis TaxID=239974 RepID=UPI000475DECB|nr:hypothetical protein [Nocardiopsis valliformis]
MALKTKDGVGVDVGSRVWSQNGDGPFAIQAHPLGRGFLLLVGESEERTHKPEDIARYYHAHNPS